MAKAKVSKLEVGINYSALFTKYCKQHKLSPKKQQEVLKEYCGYLAPWIVSIYKLNSKKAQAGFALAACGLVYED